MANAKRKVSGNVGGEFFVDTTCIDCDTCRELAPEVFEDDGEHSFVRAQPATTENRRAALRALVACPTGSIGIDRAEARGDRNGEIESAVAEFPLPIEGGVSYCGFASPDSFGASSYLVEHAAGNGSSTRRAGAGTSSARSKTAAGSRSSSSRTATTWRTRADGRSASARGG
jgi:ferredoxin